MFNYGGFWQVEGEGKLKSSPLKKKKSIISTYFDKGESSIILPRRMYMRNVNLRPNTGYIRNVDDEELAKTLHVRYTGRLII